MSDLHLNYSWFLMLIGVVLVSVGFYRSYTQLTHRISDHESSEQRLEAELRSRVRTENEMREKDLLLKQAAELAKLGHCIWDSVEDRCVYCSDEYARIHGVTPDQYLQSASTNQPAFNHPDDIEAYKSAIVALRGGQPFEMEYRIVDGRGNIRIVQESGNPEFGPDGKVVREFLTLRDVTDRKRVEMELSQFQKSEAVGQLASGIAHDFNNLLAVILGNAQLIAEKQVASVNPLIQPIIGAASRGQKLTKHLLAFSRKQSLEPRAIDVPELFIDVRAMLTRTLGKGIRIETRIADDVFPVFADPYQLENALINLAVNARDAMPEGGILTFEASNRALRDEAEATGDLREDNEFVELRISDTGHGMSESVKNRAIDPFFTTKQVGQGSGLGLSMVFGFVNQTGGHMKIESKAELGTVVRLYLPKARHKPESVKADNRISKEGSGETVLVIDDEVELLNVVSSMLDGLNYRTITANCVEEAKREIERKQVDLVLTDIALKNGESGFDVYLFLKKHHPSIKVVFMSGNAQDIISNKLRGNNETKFIQKPFSKADLARIMST